jgi:tRNA(Ile)-lysidine synthetase-like protein
MDTEVIRYWFKLDLLTFRPEWFDGSIDTEIREKFGDLHHKVEKGECESWKDTIYGKLAYIIVLDQFTRNLHRDGDFRRNDKKALEVVEDMLSKREDLNYNHFVERMFILLPLRHSKVSKNIRRVLEILEEYKTEFITSLEIQYLEKFKCATIKDLTKTSGEYNYNTKKFKSIDYTHYSNILDLDYGSRESLNSKVDLEKVVKQYLDKYTIQKLGVSLSGGIDSMVLLQILKKLLGKDNLVCGYISHSNRDVAESELEFLIDWCNNLEVQLVYRKVDYMNRESVDREFYEEETRNIRFELYRHIVRTYSLDGVCLGHHRDDIGENVMMNILQGRDVVDLKGMNDRKDMYGVTICRPMLRVKKDTVWSYGYTHNVSCFLDSTPDWSWRGVLRRKIYPRLDERVGSIHTLLAALGDKSEEWNTVIEKMVFNPIYEKVEYLKNGCILRLDKVALDMPNSFYTKLLVHVFHSMNVRMISNRCMVNFLEWLKDTGKDTHCRLSNDYMAIKECSGEIIVYIVKSEVFVKEKWNYIIMENTEVLNIDTQETFSQNKLQPRNSLHMTPHNGLMVSRRQPCNWVNILNGYYEFTSGYDIEEVDTFNKSDKNRKLYKGFNFLPKLVSNNCVSNKIIKIFY